MEVSIVLRKLGEQTQISCACLVIILEDMWNELGLYLKSLTREIWYWTSDTVPLAPQKNRTFVVFESIASVWLWFKSWEVFQRQNIWISFSKKSGVNY